MKSVSHKKTNIVGFHGYEVLKSQNCRDRKYNGGFLGAGEDRMGSYCVAGQLLHKMKCYEDVQQAEKDRQLCKHVNTAELHTH